MSPFDSGRGRAAAFAQGQALPMALVAAGTLCRVLYAWTHPVRLLIVERLHDDLAWNLARGLGYSLDGKTPWFYPAPLYPFLLSLFYRAAGHLPSAAALLQAGLDGLALVLVYRLARLYYSRPVSCLALALCAFYPAFWTYDALLFLESALGMGVLLFTYLLARAWKRGRLADWAVAGGALAALSYLKATGLVLPFLLLPAAFAREPERRPGAVKGAAVLLLCLALAVLPWLARNRSASGRWLPMSSGLGATLWLGVHPAYEGCWPPPRDDQSDLMRDTGGVPYPDYFGPETDARLRASALAQVKARPLETLALFGKKLVYFWTGNRYFLLGLKGDLAADLREDLERRGWAGTAYSLLRRFLLLPVLLALAAAALWRERERPRLAELWPLCLCPLAWNLVHSVLVIESGRYYVPVFAPVLVLSAAGAFIVLGRPPEREGA